MDDKSTYLRMSEATDEGLASRLKEGDARAFELLYERYAARALRVAWGVTGGRGLAEEAVQEAFTSIWQNADRYDPHLGSFQAWALSMVRYRAIDVLRKRAREATDASVEELIALPDEQADTEAAVTERLETVRMRRHLAQLPLPSASWSCSRTSAASRTASSRPSCRFRSARSRDGCAWRSRSCATPWEARCPNRWRRRADGSAKRVIRSPRRS
jgi:RNA polymerase sigma factor (sigma-70 family)